MTSGGQQPQQPQQKDWKKWLQSKLNDDYKRVPLKSDSPDASDTNKHHNHHGKNDQQEQNASLIIESVGKLLDSVGKNFIPTVSLKNLKDLWDKKKSTQVNTTDATSDSSEPVVLKMVSGLEKSSSSPSTLEKLQNQLDVLKFKFFTAIQKTNDKKVEADIRNIIDNMRDQVRI